MLTLCTAIQNYSVLIVTESSIITLCVPSQYYDLKHRAQQHKHSHYHHLRHIIPTLENTILPDFPRSKVYLTSTPNV